MKPSGSDVLETWAWTSEERTVERSLSLEYLKNPKSSCWVLTELNVNPVYYGLCVTGMCEK